MAVRAFIFPGQGSQTVGMGRDLAAAFLPAREVFEEVNETLSQSLSRLMFEGPLEDADADRERAARTDGDVACDAPSHGEGGRLYPPRKGRRRGGALARRIQRPGGGGGVQSP